MRLNTCSEVISFAKELESESAKFYEELSHRYPRDADVFLSTVKENRKNVVAIERAYYGVISDALEGCFAFSVNPDEYKFSTQLAGKASYSDALDMALEIETKVIKFYSDAAAQSRSLMADVPRAFATVAKKRNNRISKLRALFG